MYEEDCYPRGGERPSHKNTPHSNKQENLFALNKTFAKSKKQRTRNVRTSKSVDGQEDTYRSTSAEVLKYKTVTEGMLVLGCIKDISSLSLCVELPGRMFCTLQINSISDAFTKRLTERLENDEVDEDTELQTLNNVFTRGQFIPTKVINIVENEEHKRKVFLSAKPDDINASYVHSDFKRGTLVWAAVVEKSDHGYILQVGVKHVRIMLPFKYVEQDKVYVVGEPLWCVVKTAENSRLAATLTVSALKDDVNSCVEDDTSHLAKIVPGMCVCFRAEKSLKDGLEGSILANCVAYVNEIHLVEPLDFGEKYVGETIRALVLYVQPTTKFSFLTLRTERLAQQPNLKIGQILSAQVISRLGRGIAVKLSKTEKGFVTYHRVKNSLQLTDESDLKSMVETKYPVGSTHKTRILDYVYTDRLYICTFEWKLLNETLFTSSDVKVGEIVRGTVARIQEAGLLIRIGNVTGFVLNEHLSNAKYKEVFKSKFKIGQAVAPRVWLNKGSSDIKLTLKSAFLESNVCLKSYKEARVNSQYPGMVIKITMNGALIKFYNDVQGWLIPSAHNSHHNFKQLLYSGQVVLVWIVKKEGERLTLSLDDPSSSAPEPNNDVESVVNEEFEIGSENVTVGDIVHGKISKVDHDGLHVVVGPNETKCFVPTSHLCSNPLLGRIMLDFYNKGDKLSGLICLSNGTPKFLSLTEHRYFTEENYTIPKKLKNASIVRCYIRTLDETHLSLLCPTRRSLKDVAVDKNDIGLCSTGKVISWYNYQPIMARISTIGNKRCPATATTYLNETFKLDLDYSARRLQRYLDDVDLIREKAIACGDPLGCYKLGQRVLCTVQNVNNNGCILVLNDGVKGFARKQNCPENIQVGSSHTGAVIWVNFIRNRLEIVLTTQTVDKINTVQDGIIKASPGSLLKGQTLLIHEDFVQCVLDPGGNGQLAFIPTHLHENDFVPDCSHHHQFKHVTKLKINSLSSRHIIGYENPIRRCVFRERQTLEYSSEEEIADITGDTVDVVTNGAEHSAESVLSDDGMQNGYDEESRMEEDGDDVVNTTKEQTEETSFEREEDDSVASKEKKRLLRKKRKILHLSAEIQEDESKMSDQPTENFKLSKNVEPKLPGVQNFFDSDEDDTVLKSSDEEMEQGELLLSQSKKRKVSRNDKAESARQQEEYLRKKEEEFANPEGIPQTAEQFDRKLLGEPNSSELWAQYIAFHVQSTEIDKARAVIQRALKTIQQSAVQDRQNIWITYLNLEGMYGTKETFDKVFEEAVRCNDALTVYLEAIKILTESSNFDAADVKIKKARGKFKQDSEMYTEIARIYYKQKKLADARRLKDNALRTISDKKLHVPLIVQFAIMEFNDGEESHGEALLETVLQSDPRRTDVWSTYVDQLVKRNKIDLARRVLEKAVAQKLNYKKMKVLYKKFQEFERKHGTSETQEHVKKLLGEYASQFTDT